MMRQEQTKSEKTWDVIVIGAGPSGCGVASLLAQKGWKVLVLEKEAFPRYHIGESLIPYCWFPLKKIGILDKLKAADFTSKQSVQFVSTEGIASKPFYFFEHIQHPCAQTWQVSRSDFDHLMLRHAEECGALIKQSTTVLGLIQEEGFIHGVEARTGSDQPCQYQAKITIDASGRSMMSASRFGWRQQDPSLKKIAIWSYYKGAQRDAGIDAGATTVAFLPHQGWFWYIPLREDTTSVGVVAERSYLFDETNNIEEIFEREIRRQPWISKRTKSAERISHCQVTNDYSNRAKHCAANGLVLIGDAFAFLDPVFSSGVFLALQSAVMAADAVDAALISANAGAEQFQNYGRELCEGIERMRTLIYAFYTEGFSFAELLRAHPEVHGDLTDCLIGNLWKDYDLLFSALGEQCDLPAALPYGYTSPQPTGG